MGRSRSQVISEFLLDSAPIARSMAVQIAQLKGGRSEFVRRVLALSESVTTATNETLERARSGGGVPLAGGHPHDLAETLTPPSSNTGGKVLRKPKKPRGEA
jgi:polysaccharide deacetylase 2 family uncharacterized protein YibQ